VALSPLAAFRAAHQVRQGGFDVVHMHEPLAPVLGYGFVRGGTVPVVATFHRAGSGRGYRLAGHLAHPMVTRLGASTAVSEAAGETARQVFGIECTVLFNGVDLSRFAGVTPAPTDRPTVAFLGRHEPRKGLSVLLRAFERVEDPAVLWIIGDGPESAELRRHYPESDRIRWLGALDDDAAASRLAGADVFCAPSVGGESFGVVLLEAMAARTAVVASDLAGYRAAAAEHATFVPPRGVDALATAIGAALRRGTRASGGSTPGLDAAQAWAREHSMDRLAELYVAIYESVVASRGPAAPPRR
jgi:phosphatidylinositol alpha-mannosyltransferase